MSAKYHQNIHELIGMVLRNVAGVKMLSLLDMVVCEPIIRDVANTTLVGMSLVIEGPVVRVGITVIRSM